MSLAVRWRERGKTHLVFSIFLVLLSALIAPRAVAQTGVPFSWGDNFSGQLGIDSSLDPKINVSTRNYADAVALLQKVSQVSVGGGHCLALKSDGTVWAWGENFAGQLGDGTNEASYIPLQVPGLTNVVQVEAGAVHSLALRSDGTVWTWGMGLYGQLGNGTAELELLNNPNANVSFDWYSIVPVQVVWLDASKKVLKPLTGIVQIATGAGHTLALKSDGTVWAWGYNYDGELGDGTAEMDSSGRSRNVATQVVDNQKVALTGVVQVAVGAYHSLALLSDGTVRAWGYGTQGQLGDGKSGGEDPTGQPSSYAEKNPVVVSNLANVWQISAGDYHSLALTADRNVWAWGWNFGGQVEPSLVDQVFPVSVTNTGDILQVVGGYTHTAILRDGGTVWTWGMNGKGQLGNGDLFDVSNQSPAQVMTPIANTNPVTYTQLTNQTYIASKGDVCLSLSATKRDTTTKTPDIKKEYGEPIPLSATLYTGKSFPLANRIIRFYADSQLIAEAITSAVGVTSIVAPKTITPGSYKLKAEFVGDGLFNPSISTNKLTINKAKTTLSVNSPKGKMGETVTLVATLKRVSGQTPLAGMQVSFFLDDKRIAPPIDTDSSGQAKLSYQPEEPIKPGTHRLKALFKGDSNHYDSENVQDFVVNKAETFLSRNSRSGVYGQTVTFQTKLTRQTDNKGLPNRFVTFLLDSQQIGRVKTNADGLATLDYLVDEPLKTGDRTVDIQFDGDDYYLAKTGTTKLTISKANTEVREADATGKKGDTVTLQVTRFIRTSQDKKPVAGRTINFFVDGKKVGTGKTGSDGKTTFSYKITQSSGNYGLKVTFDGDDFYKASSYDGATLKVK